MVIHFLDNWAELFAGTKVTNIYRLLVRNKSYAAQFLISSFWALIGGKKRVTSTLAPKGLGP